MSFDTSMIVQILSFLNGNAIVINIHFVSNILILTSNNCSNVILLLQIPKLDFWYTLSYENYKTKEMVHSMLDNAPFAI